MHNTISIPKLKREKFFLHFFSNTAPETSLHHKFPELDQDMLKPFSWSHISQQQEYQLLQLNHWLQLQLACWFCFWGGYVTELCILASFCNSSFYTNQVNSPLSWLHGQCPWSVTKRSWIIRVLFRIQGKCPIYSKRASYLPTYSSHDSPKFMSI